jgi:hypothetical protein
LVGLAVLGVWVAADELIRVVWEGKRLDFWVKLSLVAALGDHGVSPRSVVVPVLDVGLFVVSGLRFVRAG